MNTLKIDLDTLLSFSKVGMTCLLERDSYLISHWTRQLSIELSHMYWFHIRISTNILRCSALHLLVFGIANVKQADLMTCVFPVQQAYLFCGLMIMIKGVQPGSDWIANCSKVLHGMQKVNLNQSRRIKGLEVYQYFEHWNWKQTLLAGKHGLSEYIHMPMGTVLARIMLEPNARGDLGLEEGVMYVGLVLCVDTRVSLKKNEWIACIFCLFKLCICVLWPRFPGAWQPSYNLWW